ncbi:hypothetical protein [Aliiruegeria lutimaris]|nr:hypothetical protein [Aliiruegeria lutimaris]
MSAKKNLVINQVKSVPIQNAPTVPTAVAYDGKKPLIGWDAQENNNGQRVYRNFKVELGRQTRQQASMRQQQVSSSHKRSVLGMSKDFIEGLLIDVEAYVDRQGGSRPSHVLIAEPLSIEEEGKASGQWLSNYRSALQTILGHKFENVGFMPEPFAVFQYYRYGFRHPLLTAGRKHVALVLDFGGGTFDVSVIETTVEGDISLSGKNSKPLSAKSIPIGGFFINRMIAEDLLFNSIEDKWVKKNSRKLLGAIDSFQSLTETDEQRFTAAEVNFIRNFGRLVDEVESAKVSICNSILSWDLSANLERAPSYLVNVPTQPFETDSPWIEVSLRANRLREIFVQKVWRAHLQEAVTEGLERAKNELKGQPIAVVLLSGGSTNIGWTKELVDSDLRRLLGAAVIIEISDNYQEVVAKGLAIECARRFYTEQHDGDFGAVTYNRLNLSLRPDSKKLEWCSFKPQTDGLPTPGDKGTLLPSASGLRAFIDTPMHWKARMNSGPTQFLEYHFLKSSFDPTDTDCVQNILDQKVYTPRGTKHGQFIEVELVVREDGTASPTFVYGKGKDSEKRVVGAPFFLDMTFASEPNLAEGYLGIDFGTATSSVSSVSEADVRALSSRAFDRSWLDLNELIQALPYCLSSPLRDYVAQTDQHQLKECGRHSFEAFLTYICFVCYCEFRSLEMDLGSVSLDRNFRRSAGPLLREIRELARILKKSGKEGLLSERLLSFLDDPIYQQIDSTVSGVARGKHGQAADIDFSSVLIFLGNLVQDSHRNIVVGNFESLRKIGFSGRHSGIFREFKGASQPFSELYDYSGEGDFSPEFVYVVNLETGRAFSLTPLLIWGLGSLAGQMNGEDLYFLDVNLGRENEVRYVKVKIGEPVSPHEHSDTAEVAEATSLFFKGSWAPEPVEGVELRSRKRA